MAARRTLGDQGSPQAEGGGAAQDGTDVSRILDCLKENAVASRRGGHRDGDFGQQPGWAVRIREPFQEGIGKRDRRPAGAPDEGGDFRPRCAGLADQHGSRLDAGIEARRQQVRAFDQGAALFLAHTAVADEGMPAPHSRIVAGAQDAHACTSRRTGANERR
jgi:hypothetical protein